MTTISRFLHVKCRNSVYPRSNVHRVCVPDEKVHWEISWSDYKPLIYTSPVVCNKPWADPGIDTPGFYPKWNSLDDNVNRKSYEGEYKIHDGQPLNPFGRTGIQGQGLLGRWGPNHAADPLVTRWDPIRGRPHLQFVAIKRGDCGEWALPGGMVDPGETVSQTLLREFHEEALASSNASAFFENIKGFEVYRGYVDDPRNTDNAWMETVCVNFHDELNTLADTKLNAGDDAVGVRWQNASRSLNLYASHTQFVEKVVRHHNAKW